MVNHINTFRVELKKDFDEKPFIKEGIETYYSPSNKYRLDTTKYNLTTPNWGIIKVELYQHASNEKMQEFIINDDHFAHGWFTINSIDYLICSENIFGGQTIIDLTNNIINSYSPKEEGFIWTDFYLSPNGKNLATIGCFWACPYVIKIYDFSTPLSLPLTEIKEIPLLENSEIIYTWLDNNTIQFRLSETELIKEELNDGTYKYKAVTKAIGKTREIKINGE